MYILTPHTNQLIKLPYSHVLTTALWFCNMAALAIYTCLRILFNGFTISFMEDVANLLQSLFIASALATGLYAVYAACRILQTAFTKKTVAPVIRRTAVAAAACLILLVGMVACSAGTKTGINKDFNTGLTATWTDMEPGEVLLVMNGEALNHTDIPIGESFILANKDIKGMVVKDGKISAGCALKIADKKGNILLEEADLLKGNDVFDAADASLLKCTVNTGEPMQWEEQYDVQVTFWDKYGTGRIDNKVTIRAIDIP